MKHLPLILIAVVVVFSLGYWSGRRARSIAAPSALTVIEHEGHYDVLRGDGSVWLSEFDTREEAERAINDNFGKDGDK